MKVKKRIRHAPTKTSELLTHGNYSSNFSQGCGWDHYRRINGKNNFLLMVYVWPVM